MASKEDRQAVADFVRSLYELGGFESWGEYAREAGFLASSMSDWSRGENAPSGPTLVRLIHTATDRAPLALREAAERTSPLNQVRDRLESALAEAEYGRSLVIAGLTSIDTRLSRIERSLGLPAPEAPEVSHG